MVTALPEGASEIEPSDTASLRFALRTDGKGGFLFVNNFQDHRDMPARRHEAVRIQVRDAVYDFDISLASDENVILPFAFDMDGILLRQACAQPLLRTVIDGRVTYAFMVPEGMDGAFCFEDSVAISCGTALPQGSEAHRFTVAKDERTVDVLVLSREMAGQLYRLKSGGLLFTDAALLEGPDRALRLETTRADNTLYALPACLPEAARTPLNDCGPLAAYRACAAPRDIPLRVVSTAPRRWTVTLSARSMAGLKDIRLQIDYTGDIGMLFLGNTLISDNFCNGDTWEVGLREFFPEAGALTLTLVIVPLRRGRRIHADSPMAARSEQADATVATLSEVRAQPVYEILI